MSLRYFYIFLLLFLFPFTLAGQQQTYQASGTTIRTNARIVVVDVIATDSSGRPVKGLTAKDFSLFEDKKQQSLTAFDEHFLNHSYEVADHKLNLPPDTYTNYIPTDPAAPVNIILIDLLNTRPENIEFVKAKVVEMLQKLPPHQRVALFTLTTQLHMIQGFDSSSDQLIAATKNISVLPNNVLKTVQQTSSEIQNARETISSPKMLASVVQFLIEEHGGHTDAQVSYTMEALTHLARAVAVIPGRKNLIWLSDSTPFSFLPGTEMGREYRDSIRSVSALLAATQIAVFPVDARGLATTSPSAAVSSGEAFGDTGGFLNVQMGALNSAYQSMDAFAEETGGKVFHNTNDLGGAIRKSMELGSSYYTLSYHPTNNDWNGKFRKISVKSNRRVSLLYRAGYYSVPDPLKAANDPEQALNTAIMPFVPTSTVLLMKVKVVPPKHDSEPALIDVLLDPHDLQFGQKGDQKALSLRFMSVAFDSSGKSAGAVGGNVDQSFDKKGLEFILKNGIQFHQKLPIKSGTYTLRIGVIDRHSGRLGTLEVPVTVPATSAN